jgi:heparan-alpha-glucosaminide N-acetyltransferase
VHPSAAAGSVWTLGRKIELLFIRNQQQLASIVSETENKATDGSYTPHSVAPNSPQAPVERIASVDTLRGLVILLMVFVNDLGPAAPSWMHHIQPPDADGMTLADIVFPAFLFIVGISIPLAVERALERGKSYLQILRHVLARTAGLLTMGLIGVNQAVEVNYAPHIWGLLAYISIILAWCIVPKETGPKRVVLLTLKATGVIGVLALLATFRSEPVATEVLFLGEVEEWRWLRTQWWGILGLIGWAYLVASLTYLLLRPRREWLMGAMAMLVVLYIGIRGNGLFAHVSTKSWLDPIAPILSTFQSCIAFAGKYLDLAGALGSLASVSVAGSLLGSTLAGPQKLSQPAERTRWALSFALGLFLAGLLCDGFAGINKIAATPTWCLWCAALTCVTWVIVYRIMDVGNRTRWAFLVRPAGANPLIAYLLHPILLWSLSTVGLSTTLLTYKGSEHVAGVVFGSIVMSLLVSGLTGAIARAGLRVRI